jgi:hypothetical protein
MDSDSADSRRRAARLPVCAHAQLPAVLQKAAGCSDPRCSSCDELFEAAMRTSKCSLCSLRYCSAACQARSWPVHKAVCKGRAAAWAATEASLESDEGVLPRLDLTRAELVASTEFQIFVAPVFHELVEQREREMESQLRELEQLELERLELAQELEAQLKESAERETNAVAARLREPPE